MTDRLFRDQIALPGQTSVAPGPHDHSPMYVMHYALRRDAATFLTAVVRTPMGDPAAWRTLSARWLRFADVLHHQQRAEDRHYWPVVRAAAAARGSAADVAVLDALEAEHLTIEAAAQACTTAFRATVEHPYEDRRQALEGHLASLRALLETHLRHEELALLPLVQRVVTREEFAGIEREVPTAYPVRSIAFLVPWSTHGLPPDLARRYFATTRWVYSIFHALTLPWFLRGERRAFAYAADPLG